MSWLLEKFWIEILTVLLLATPNGRALVAATGRTARNLAQAAASTIATVATAAFWRTVGILAITVFFFILTLLTGTPWFAFIALIAFGLWMYFWMQIIHTIVGVIEGIHAGTAGLVRDTFRPISSLVMLIGTIILSLSVWPGLLGLILVPLFGVVFVFGAWGIYFETERHLFQKVMMGFTILSIIALVVGIPIRNTELGQAINGWLKQQNKGLASAVRLESVVKSIKNFTSDKKGEMAEEMIRKVSYEQWGALGWNIPVIIVDGQGQQILSGDDKPDLDHQWILVIERDAKIPGPVQNRIKGLSMTKIQVDPINPASVYFIPSRAIDWETLPPNGRKEAAQSDTATAIEDKEVFVERTKPPIIVGTNRVKVAGEFWSQNTAGTWTKTQISEGERDVINVSDDLPEPPKGVIKTKLPAAEVGIKGPAIKIELGDGTQGWVPARNAVWVINPLLLPAPTDPGGGGVVGGQTGASQPAQEFVLRNGGQTWTVPADGQVHELAGVPTPAPGQFKRFDIPSTLWGYQVSWAHQRSDSTWTTGQRPFSVDHGSTYIQVNGDSQWPGQPLGIKIWPK